MKIAITGVTGQLGRQVVSQLQSKVGAESIVALARTPGKAASLGVPVREADYDKPETLEKALAGVEAVLLISSYHSSLTRILAMAAPSGRRPGDGGDALQLRGLSHEAVVFLIGGIDCIDGGFFLALGGPQHAPEPLNALARTGRRTRDDGHGCFRHVHSFVEGAAGDQDIENAPPEQTEIVPAHAGGKL